MSSRKATLSRMNGLYQLLCYPTGHPFLETLLLYNAPSKILTDCDIYEGHFRSNVNVIISTYSMLFTSKAVYHRKVSLRAFEMN